MTKPISLVPELYKTISAAQAALSALQTEIRSQWESADDSRRRSLLKAHRAVCKLVVRSRRAAKHNHARDFSEPQCSSRDVQQLAAHRARIAHNCDVIQRGTLYYLRVLVDALRVVRPELAGRCGDFLGSTENFSGREVYSLALLVTAEIRMGEPLLRQVSYAIEMLGCARDKWAEADLG